MKKVISRTLTSKGLLITFEGDVNMLLTNDKLTTMKLADMSIPSKGQEIAVRASVDAAGNASTQWVDLDI